MRVKVVGPSQVAHRDKVYAPGDSFDAPDVDARGWIRRGYVSEVKAKEKAAPKAPNKALKTADNKAVESEDDKSPE